MQRNFLQPSSGWNTMDDDNPNKIETVYQSWQTQSPRDRTAIQPFGRHNFDVVSQEANRNRQNESFFQNFYSDYRKDLHFYYQFPKSEVQETWNYADKSDSYQAQTQNPSSQYSEYKNNLCLSNNSFPHINTSYSREYAATGTYKGLRQNSSSQYCSDTPYKDPRLWDYEDNTGTTDYPKAISLTPTTKKRQVMDKLSPFRSKRRKTSGSFIKKFGSPQKNTLDRYLVKRNLKYNPKSECVESPSSNSHLSAKCDKKEIGNVGECQDDDDVIIVESKSRDVPIQTSVEDDNVGENQNNECHDDDLICIFDSKSSDGTRKFNQIDTCETSKEDLNQNSVTIVISDDDDFYSKSSDITRKVNEIDTCETSKENLNQNSFTIVISDDDDFDSKSSDSTRKMNQIDTCETSKENFNQNSVNSDDWHNDLKKDDIVDQNDFIINIESDVNIVSSKGNNSIISLSDDSSQSIGNGIDISPVDNLDILEIETSLPDIHYELFSCKSLGQNQSTQNLPSTDKQSNILSLTPCQNSRENQISSLIASNKCDTELNVSGTRRCDVTDQDKQIEVRPKSVSENIECLHIHKTCNAEKNILSGESKELNIYKESNKENSPSLSNKEIHHGGPGSENFAHNTEMLTSSDHFQNVSKFVVPKSETESALTNIFCVDNVGISSSNAWNVNNNNTNNINKNINNSDKRAFIDIDVPIVNNIGDNIFVSESSLQVKYTKTHNLVNSTSELLISNNRSANYPTNCENIPLKQCNPSSVLDSAWSSTKAVDQESCPSVDVKGSVEDSQENVKEPDTLNFRSASSSSNETNKSEFKDETMQEGHYDSSAKKPINVTPNDFIVSVQKVMFERHNEAARRMGLRRVTPCCINPYSCKKFHRSRGSRGRPPSTQSKATSGTWNIFPLNFRLFEEVEDFERDIVYPPQLVDSCEVQLYLCSSAQHFNSFEPATQTESRHSDCL